MRMEESHFICKSFSPMSWQAGGRRRSELASSHSESASTGAQTGVKILEVDVISGNQSSYVRSCRLSSNTLQKNII